MSSKRLHVITTLSNPYSFNSRYALYDRFVENVLRAGAKLTVIELVYDDRITMADKIGDAVKERLREREYDINYIPLRTRNVMWHKENLINIGFKSLPNDWKYAAWIDADVEFQRPKWDDATIRQLNHFDVVQMFSHAVDVDPDHQLVDPTRAYTSFMASYRNGAASVSGRYDDHNHHPGYCWAIRRDAYEDIGGLLDTAILGAGDRHMAMGLIGKAHLSYPGNVTQGYKDSVLAWQALANRYVRGNVGYVPGLLIHWWHGRKRDRRYHDRWRILVKHKFNPVTDLRMNRQTGLWRWSNDDTHRMRCLRDDVRSYFGSRREDSVDVD